MERFACQIPQQQQGGTAGCYENLVNLRMGQGLDPDDYTFKLLKGRRRLHEMGKEISDEKFGDILLQGLTDDYEFVKMTSFRSPTFGIDDFQ